MLDADLAARGRGEFTAEDAEDRRAEVAELYGVETKQLVQAVKRNLDRFPIEKK